MSKVPYERMHAVEESNQKYKEKASWFDSFKNLCNSIFQEYIIHSFSNLYSILAKKALSNSMKKLVIEIEEDDTIEESNVEKGVKNSVFVTSEEAKWFYVDFDWMYGKSKKNIMRINLNLFGKETKKLLREKLEGTKYEEQFSNLKYCYVDLDSLDKETIEFLTDRLNEVLINREFKSSSLDSEDSVLEDGKDFLSQDNVRDEFHRNTSLSLRSAYINPDDWNEKTQEISLYTLIGTVDKFDVIGDVDNTSSVNEL